MVKSQGICVDAAAIVTGDMAERMPHRPCTHTRENPAVNCARPLETGMYRESS